MWRYIRLFFILSFFFSFASCQLHKLTSHFVCPTRQPPADGQTNIFWTLSHDRIYPQKYEFSLKQTSRQPYSRVEEVAISLIHLLEVGAFSWVTPFQMKKKKTESGRGISFHHSELRIVWSLSASWLTGGGTCCLVDSPHQAAGVHHRRWRFLIWGTGVGFVHLSHGGSRLLSSSWTLQPGAMIG